MKEASVDTMKVMERITTPAPLEPLCDLSIEGNDESSTLSFSLDGCFINSPKDATPSTLLLVSRHCHPIRFDAPVSVFVTFLARYRSLPAPSQDPHPTPRLHRVDGLGCVLEADSSGSILVQHCLFVSCMSNSTTNWIHLLGADANTLNKENWEGTLSTSSLRSSVLLSSSTQSASSISDVDPHSLLYEFYPRTTPRIVVQKDGKNEDHPLCGSSELPCLSVDTSFGLTKVRTVEITGEGEVKTQMRMDGDFLTIEGHKKRDLDLSQSTLEEGGIVVNENGEVKLDSNTVSSLFTIKSSLIQLTGGQAVVINLTLTDLSFSPTVFDFSLFDLVSLSEVSTTNCSIGKFVKASEGTNFSLKSSSFIGQHKTTTVNDETEEDEAHYVCDWSDSFVTLVNTTSVFENVKFSHHRIGAVEMDGGSLRVEASTFHDNAVDNSSFPSVRRNIHCLTGQLTVETLSGGDGTKDFPSAWINVEEECHFSSPIVDPHTPLFIPALLPSLSKVETNKKTSQTVVKLAGKLLIPCGLSLDVFEWNEKSQIATDKSTEVSLATANIQNWNEASLELTLNESSLSKTLKIEHEWRLRLVFGNGVSGTEWITVKKSRAAEKKAHATEAMKVLLPIVISLIVALVLFIVIVCVIYHRRKGKKSDEQMTLLTQQELDAVDIKVEVDESLNIMDDRSANNFPSDTIGDSKLLIW
ncbi:hypothetical protein BLNAU_22987 [Blattamonas nauphoetae]|uniref:Uncharacterized protein n=1 Tax=Blattamonas nauphoetae TaxID=2049346 RepID=A0ABQ9WVQ5_9EUKA|nr:hypothetical protein BLNAU_22987 [Blattamonas nauphoetae]